MNRTLIILALIILTTIPFSYAVNDFAYNRLYDGTQPIDGLNYSINTNSSNYWNTNSLGSLGDANSTQFENSGGVLTALKSWWDGLYCELTGCTMQGDITFENAAIQNPNYIQFNTTWMNGGAEGRLQWNTDDGTLEVGMPGGDVNLQIGQENLIRATNKEGSTIPNGKVVFISGASGSNPEIKISSNDNVTKSRTIGVATEDILDNQKGYVTAFGLVRDINTSNIVDGGIAWLGTNGDITSIRPTSPTAQIAIGIILRSHETEGILYTNPLILQQLSQLSDVYSVGLTDNSIVQYNSTSSRFEMTTTPTFDNLTINNIFQANGVSYFGPNANQSLLARNPGDVAIERTVYINESAVITAYEFGVGLVVQSIEAHDPNKRRILQTPGLIMNTTTGLFCDTTNTPFFENDTGKFVGLLFTNVFGQDLKVLEILSVINSTCIDLSLASFGASDVSDIAVFVYAIGPPAILAVFERGSFLSTIGAGDQSSFKINVPEANGPSSFDIESTVGSHGANIFEIATDLNGSLDSSNFESLMFSSEQVNGTVQHNLEIIADLTNFNDGSYIGIEMPLISEGNNMDTTAISVSSLFDNIITSSKQVDISLAYYDDTTTISDITSDIDDPQTLTTLFQENDSSIYFGNTINFTKITISVDTGASQSILPDFLYCNSSGEWESLMVADSTQGFLHSGTINFGNPLDRGTCNQALDGTPFANTTDFTYIAIRRTEISVTDDPVVSSIGIFDEQLSLSVTEEGGIKLFNNEINKPSGPVFEVVKIDREGFDSISALLQFGENNSAHYFDRSIALYPQINIAGADRGNATYLARARNRMIDFGFTPKLDFDTDNAGNDLWVYNAIMSQKLFLTDDLGNGAFEVEVSDFSVQLNEGHADFFGKPIHSAIPVTFPQGFTQGEEVVKFTETFSGGLGIFTNLQVDAGNWFATTDPLCSDGPCAKGSGAGVGIVDMATNSSTLDINDTKLSFVYSLQNLIGVGDFEVFVNNNIGSGDVSIFSDSTDDVVNSQQTISLPTSMDNQSILTIKFTCTNNVGQPLRSCFVDNVKLNGTAMTTTLINVSGFNSELCFSEGLNTTDNFCDRGIIYNASLDQIIFRGNVTSETIHQQDLNITTSITLGGETIQNWDNISTFDDNVLLVDGSRVADSLNVSGNATFQNNVTILGTLFGGSPVKVSGGINVSNGDVETTGSLMFQGNSDERFRFDVDPDTGMPKFEKWFDTFWEPGSLEVGTGTVWFGPNTGGGGSGHHFVTETSDGDIHYHAHNEVIDGLTTSDAKIVYLYDYFHDVPIQPDDSGEWEGINFKFNMTPSSHSLLDVLTIKTGSTAATKYIELKVRKDDPDTGAIILKQKYPASYFTSDTTVPLNISGGVEFEAGTDFFFEYSSSENFSMKTNADETNPWAMICYSAMREDNMLQTAPWVNNTSYPVGQSMIYNRTIYVSNDSSVQIGSFESNLDKWRNTASQSDMSYWTKIGSDLSYDSGSVVVGGGDIVSINGNILAYGENGESTNFMAGWYAGTDTPDLSRGIGIGFNALYNSTATDRVIAIGFDAGRDSSGNNGLYLGDTAGFGETEDNKFWVSNVLNDLIEGDFDNQWLKVYNRLTIGNPTSLSNPFHVYESTSNTAGAAGATIENAGTGDAALHFLITGERFFTIGLDNSADDSFVLGKNADMDTDPYLTIATNNFGSTVSGNVGIGTTEPGAKLDVNTDARLHTFSNTLDASSELRILKAGVNGLYDPLRVGDEIGQILWQGSNNVEITDAASIKVVASHTSGDWTSGVRRTADMTFSTVDANSFEERMRITSDGNVGIGTDNPLDELTVNGSIGIRPTSGAASLRFWGGDTTSYTLYADGGGNFIIKDTDNGTNRLLIDDSGNVGIGTTSPSQKLEVNGSVNVTENIILNESLTIGYGEAITDYKLSIIGEDEPQIFLSHDPDNFVEIGMTDTGAYQTLITGGVEYYVGGNGYFDINQFMYYNASLGRVGIGTMTPSHELNVVGDGNFTGDLTVDGLTVRNGSSIYFEDTKFTNEGHYTSVDSNWIIDVFNQATAFLGVYAMNGSINDIANLVLQSGVGESISTFNIVKSDLNDSSGAVAFINSDGWMSSYVAHDEDFRWGHFNTINSDEYGNLHNLTGVESLMTLNDDGLNLKVGDFIIDNGTIHSYGEGGETSNFIAGLGAGASLTIGHNLVLIGEGAGNALTSEEDNVFIGRYAGNNAYGSDNTFIGYGAGDGATTNDSVFIGFGAGYGETDSDKLHIANSASWSLIEGSFADKWVNINGDLATEFRGGFGRYENLMPYSEDSSNWDWDFRAYIDISSSDNLAPDGTYTADEWNTTSGNNRVNSIFPTEDTYTLSFWAKFVSGNNRLRFDFGDGSEHNVDITSTEWERYTLTSSRVGGSTWLDVRGYGGVVQVWGWQVNYGSEALPYVATGASVIAETYGAFVNGNFSVSEDVWIDGKVGIGTNSPKTDLHIVAPTAQLTLTGSSQGYINAGIVLEATEGSNSRGLGIFMHDAGADNEWFAGRPYQSQDQYQIGRQSGIATHQTDTAAITHAFMTIKNDGDVGIGTTGPGAKLDVNGDQRISGAGITTGNVLNILSPDITAGHSLEVYSNSTNSNLRALVHIVNDNSAANQAVPLLIQQDANTEAFAIDATGVTTDEAMKLNVNYLTTGKGLHIYSNAPNADVRSLLYLHNDNVNAVEAIPLRIKQDAPDRTALQIDTGNLLINGAGSLEIYTGDLLIYGGGNAYFDDGAEVRLDNGAYLNVMGTGDIKLTGGNSDIFIEDGGDLQVLDTGNIYMDDGHFGYVGDGTFAVPVKTQAQINAATKTPGMVFFNSDFGVFQGWDGSNLRNFY